jgi:hypothetical protein
MPIQSTSTCSVAAFVSPNSQTSVKDFVKHRKENEDGGISIDDERTGDLEPGQKEENRN